LCIYIGFTQVNGKEHSAYQGEVKEGFDDARGALHFNISSISDMEEFFDLFEHLWTPQHIFQKLFEPSDVVHSTSVQTCLVNGIQARSSCMQSLCEIFLSKKDSNGASVPQWALKSKIIMKNMYQAFFLNLLFYYI
jgi:hypothetical protein